MRYQPFIEGRFLDREYIFTIMQRALNELGVKFDAKMHGTDDRFTATLLGKLAFHGKRFDVTISIDGERRIIEPLHGFGKLPRAIVTVEVSPPAGLEGQLANEVEEIAQIIKNKIWDLLPKGGG